MSSSHRDSSRPVVSEGSWACPEPKCSTINSMHRKTCDACGRSKPRSRGRVAREIGKEAAEKSKGLFSAEDWSCTKCGNINWNRRTTCNICNAPKMGDAESRTGYGGGFMDRQQVEYKERGDSDEEYDEFGRKKKKQSKGEQKIRSSNDNDKKDEKSEESEGEDEDDEEDDDGDLSKYKLDDDEDEDNEKVNHNGASADGKSPATKKRKRSASPRSKSRSKSSSRSRSRSTSRSKSGSRSSSPSRSGSSRSASRSRSGSRRRSGSRSKNREPIRPAKKSKSRSGSPIARKIRR